MRGIKESTAAKLYTDGCSERGKPLSLNGKGAGRSLIAERDKKNLGIAARA